MNVNFPLISQAGVLLSLDDEEIFHRLLQKVLGGWEIRCFTDIAKFSLAMEQQVALQDQACARLTQLLSEWRDEGESLRDGLIELWAEDAFKDLAALVMVDYRMPHASGIDVLSSQTLQGWRGGKLLLTAHADDRIAVEAFNGSLIDQFLSKQVMAEDPRIIEAMVASVAEAGNDALQRVWAAQVTHQQQQVLMQCRTGVMALIRQLDWVRHAVMGQPFGILGQARDGMVQWLQLETNESLESLLELLDATDSVSDENRARIHARHALPMLETGGEEPVPVQRALELGGSVRLLGAIFDLARHQ